MAKDSDGASPGARSFSLSQLNLMATHGQDDRNTRIKHAREKHSSTQCKEMDEEREVELEMEMALKLAMMWANLQGAWRGLSSDGVG